MPGGRQTKGTPRHLAAAQTTPRAGDVPANVAQHARLARLAAELGARVVVFPELSLTGYELGLAPSLAFREHDERLAPLVAVAGECALTLAVGAPVLLASGLHIGALVLTGNGVAGIYTKRHLGAFPPGANPGGPVPPPERSVFRPGRRDPLVRAAGPGALAICADVGRPAHAARAAARGARSYLAGMFVIPADYEAEAAALAGYAARHGWAVLLANYGGPTAGLPAAGRSAAWAPDGRLLARLPAGGAGVVAAWEAPEGWRVEARVADGL